MVETKTRRGRSRPGVYQRRGRWYYTVDIKDPASGKWRKVWSHAFDRQGDAYEARTSKRSTESGDMNSSTRAG